VLFDVGPFGIRKKRDGSLLLQIIAFCYSIDDVLRLDGGCIELGAEHDKRVGDCIRNDRGWGAERTGTA
jgi:hypothetical protein